MATDKPRFSISMDEKTFEKVIAYKEEKGIATQSKAIISIMELGLRDLEKEIAHKKSPSTAEIVPEGDVLEIFSYLNEGLVSLGLINDGEDITERQADILISVARIIHAAFGED